MVIAQVFDYYINVRTISVVSVIYGEKDSRHFFIYLTSGERLMIKEVGTDIKLEIVLDNLLTVMTKTDEGE